MTGRDPFEDECSQIARIASGMRGNALILNTTGAITLADVDLHRAHLSLLSALEDIERLIDDRRRRACEVVE